MTDEDNNNNNDNKQKLPFSPAARAFFAALDEQKNDDNNKNSKKCSSSSNSSTFVQKKIQTLGWRNRYSQKERYPIQVKSSSFTVKQVQCGELDGTYGTGATVWPASIVLIKYLEKSGILHGKYVIDLGSGTGITSIAAAILGATHCICTDGEESVVQLARDNIIYTATNEILVQQQQNDNNDNEKNNNNNNNDNSVIININNCTINIQQYWWGTGKIKTQTNDEDCDIILVSDCVLPKLYPIAPLVDALNDLLIKNDAIAILSYEYRYYIEYDPKIKFIELCTIKNLYVTTIPISQHDPIYSVDDIEIWKVQRRK